ncbi:MAG: Sapep family Mn(2+)-dependent dipeptidase, partial [Eubacteriales bacterium]
IQHYVSAGEEFPIMGVTPDAAYPLINGEKGSYSATYGFQLKEDEPCRLVEFHAGTVMNVVPDYACGVLSLPQESCDFALKLDIENVKISPTEGGIKVEAFGRPAHAGNPGVGLNAIGLFYLALAQIPLQGELARLVEGMNKHFGIMVDGSGLGIATEDEVSGKLTVNVALGDLRDHVVTFTVNVRYPVTLTLESFQETLTNTMTQSGFTEKILAHKPPLYLPLESELVQKLCAVYQAQTSESAKPFCIGGATYAKELPNVVAFGPIFPGDESRIHRADEYIGLDSLLRHAQMNAAAMVELAR